MPSKLTALILLPLLSVLAGCNWVVMQPSGDIAVQQRDLIVVSTLLMLVIVLPVFLLILFFAWRYRATNEKAKYDADWHHSTRLEVVIWSAPLAIIIVLGSITWIATHKLDPYRPLDRINAERPVSDDVKPLNVEVVALDWKWMFVYPDYGIATINEMAAPVDVPINFKITSSSIMNSFYVPALAGQIYAMPGMQTKLHAVINKEGVFDGFSANYSGDGFSHMRFKFHGVSNKGFEQWVAKVKASDVTLGRDEYRVLERPSEKEPVRYFSSVEPNLFDAVVNLCVDPSKMCMKDMMHIDMMGGGGTESAENIKKLEYDNRHAQGGEDAPGATYPATERPARGEADQGQEPKALTPGAGEPQDKIDGTSEHQGHSMDNMDMNGSGGHEGHGTQDSKTDPQTGDGEVTPQVDQNGPAPAQLNNNKN